MSIPKHLDAISCYFCKHYFLKPVEDKDPTSNCSKHDFELKTSNDGFSSLFSRCEDFEEGSK